MSARQAPPHPDLEVEHVDGLGLELAPGHHEAQQPGHGVLDVSAGRPVHHLHVVQLDQLAESFSCIFACIFSCIFICIFSCFFTCIFKCIFSCIFSCIFICIFSCFFTCIFTCIFKYIFSCIFICIFSCFFTCIFRPVKVLGGGRDLGFACR